MLGVALAFGGIAQLLAGMWEFRKGNVFGATVFTSYGAFWLSFWAYLTFYRRGHPGRAPRCRRRLVPDLLGHLHHADAGRRAAHDRRAGHAVRRRRRGVRAAGVRRLRLRFRVHHAGGILGLVAAALAWYLCLAAVGASTFGRPILPNPPLFRT